MHHSTISQEQILRLISYARNGRFILFVGACGTGMSALCRLLWHRGVGVRAYDDAKPSEHDLLRREGIPFLSEPEQISDACALIVYSLAIDEGHPMMQNAYPKCSRAQLLGALMLDYPVRIAIAGSHGKSTVTSLLHQLLLYSGKNPTTVSGAQLAGEEGTLHIGDDEIFLYECCEYRDSFLYTHPTHAVLLNLELDHTDYFPDLASIKESFLRFIDRVPTLLYLGSDPNLCDIVKRSKTKRAFTLDLSEKGDASTSDFYGIVSSHSGGLYRLDYRDKINDVSISLQPSIIGRAGAINTMFAIAMTTILGISPHISTKYIKNLLPITRRMTKIGTLFGHPVYYDFAHHPTEIESTLQTLCELADSPPTVVFAPHTYSRTRDLWEGFVDAFSHARRLFLCPIYAARERPIEGITSAALAFAVGERASLISALSDLGLLCTGGAIVLMGAGDLSPIKERIEKHPAFVREEELS